MKITVVSNLFKRTDLTGEYEIEPKTTIEKFALTIDISWDNEALIVVNNKIVERDYLLQENDEVFLLTPIMGG